LNNANDTIKTLRIDLGKQTSNNRKQVNQLERRLITAKNRLENANDKTGQLREELKNEKQFQDRLQKKLTGTQNQINVFKIQIKNSKVAQKQAEQDRDQYQQGYQAEKNRADTLQT
jgi:chromosome segregation ATPase